jgi:arylsulfatase A-like enzyme
LDSAVTFMDNQVGRIMDAINYRQKNFREDWEIFVTTDHGRDSVTGKGHGGQSNRERTTWIFTNAKELNTYFKNGQPAITDITPTLLRYMNVNVDTTTAFELDGTSLTGKLSLINLVVDTSKANPIISWTPVDKSGKVKVYISTTNNIKTGGTDNYKLIGEVPVKDGNFQIPLEQLNNSSFCKIVLQAPHNTVNRWLIRQ